MRGRSLSQLTTQIACINTSHADFLKYSSCRDCRPRARIQGCGERLARIRIFEQRTPLPYFCLKVCEKSWGWGRKAYYREHTVPYSGKLSREKTFANFAVLRQNAQVSRNFGRGVLWCGKNEQSAKVLLENCMFSAIRNISAASLWNMQLPLLNPY